MNFLSLCQRLRQEAGLSGSGPVTVLGQTGEMKRIVDWISAAYEDIQNLHATWRFLRTDFSFSTIIGTQEYLPSAVDITDFAEWVKKDIRIYSAVTDESFLSYCPWAEFRTSYQFGAHRTASGRPTIVSTKPNTALVLWQVPDAVYTVTGERYKSADTMTGDTSTPNFPARFHMILVWKALMYYGAYAAADEKYAHGNNEYRLLRAQLEMDQIENMTFGDPLA